MGNHSSISDATTIDIASYVKSLGPEYHCYESKVLLSTFDGGYLIHMMVAKQLKDIFSLLDISNKQHISFLSYKLEAAYGKESSITHR